MCQSITRQETCKDNGKKHYVLKGFVLHVSNLQQKDVFQGYANTTTMHLSDNLSNISVCNCTGHLPNQLFLSFKWC